MVSITVSQTSRKTLTKNTQKRYANIRRMVDRLYSEERVRIDDVEKQVLEHFGISERTLQRALKSA